MAPGVWRTEKCRAWTVRRAPEGHLFRPWHAEHTHGARCEWRVPQHSRGPTCVTHVTHVMSTTTGTHRSDLQHLGKRVPFIACPPANNSEDMAQLLSLQLPGAFSISLHHSLTSISTMGFRCLSIKTAHCKKTRPQGIFLVLSGLVTGGGCAQRPPGDTLCGGWGLCWLRSAASWARPCLEVTG